MKEILLTQGQVALVDDDNYDELNKFKWCALFYTGTNSYYAIRSSKVDSEGKQSAILMHRVLMNPLKGLVVDHRNHNTLDNQRNNLRIVTKSQNRMNSRKYKSNTSGVTGVRWNKKNKNWSAQIFVNKKNIYLGSFLNINDAGKARKEAERKYFGEYAYNNDLIQNEKGN